MIHYFARAGVEDLTREDLISSQNPYGFQAERLQTFFFDVVNRDDGHSWSTSWIIDDPTLYYAKKPTNGGAPSYGPHDEKKSGGNAAAAVSSAGGGVEALAALSARRGFKRRIGPSAVPAARLPGVSAAEFRVQRRSHCRLVETPGGP